MGLSPPGRPSEANVWMKSCEGCYNNGTCVAPDTCRCADGWSGHDCSVPVCDEPCQHNGNCTMPGADRATSASSARVCLSWMSRHCHRREPVLRDGVRATRRVHLRVRLGGPVLRCCQALHNGECVAPDTCKCKLWDSTWPSGHTVKRPLFRKPNGDPQKRAGRVRLCYSDLYPSGKVHFECRSCCGHPREVTV